MTKRLKIAISYKDRHTREGGYPDRRTTFYEFIKVDVSEKITILTEYGKHDINIF
jgi:hypothetical protein